MNRVIFDVQSFFASDPRVIVAGYTGADQAGVRRHIDELAEIGVAPPENIPEFYPMPASSLTQARDIHSPAAGSGEAEPVLLRRDGQYFLTVGSDHTDRELEAESVARSKQVCPKPIAREAVSYSSELEDELWRTLHLSSVVDGVEYQDGAAALIPPFDVLRIYRERFGDDGSDLVLFGGTVPLLDGEFRYGSDWTMRLTLGHETITHHYRVATAPVRA